MNIRTLVNRLDEISRRDVLKGIGAAGVAAATGTIPSAPAATTLSSTLLSRYDTDPLLAKIWRSLLNAGFSPDDATGYIDYHFSSGIWWDALSPSEDKELTKKLGEDFLEVIEDQAETADTEIWAEVESALGRTPTHNKMSIHLTKAGIDPDEDFEKEQEEWRNKQEEKKRKEADIEADRERLIPDWGNVVENYQKISKRS